MSRYDHKIEPSLEGIRSPLEEPIRRALGINLKIRRDLRAHQEASVRFVHKTLRITWHY